VASPVDFRNNIRLPGEAGRENDHGVCVAVGDVSAWHGR